MHNLKNTSERQAILYIYNFFNVSHIFQIAILRLQYIYQGEHLEVKHQKDTMLQLKLSIEQDRQSIKHENQSLGHLQTDYMQIREENLRLSNMNEHLNKEFTDLLHG